MRKFLLSALLFLFVFIYSVSALGQQSKSLARKLNLYVPEHADVYRQGIFYLFYN